MNCLLIFSLLLLGTNVILGHVIKKLHRNKITKPDVYGIKENAATNTVAFVNPKEDKPILREIVYYHMIERPYGAIEGRIRYDEEEGPEIDDTMRIFTNSHGFPFLESVEKELDIETEKELEEDISNEKEETVIKDTPKEDDEHDVEYEVLYDEVEDVSVVNDKTTNKEESKEIPTAVASENAKEISTEKEITENVSEKSESEESVIEEKPELKEAVKETSSDPETTTEAHLTEETTPTVIMTESPITTAAPVFEKKAKSSRKQLFDRVRERYYTKPNTSQNSSTPERKKRELGSHIPEAPELGKLDYDSLPPHLRTLIFTEKPAADSLEVEEEGQKARTYGINLTGDNGYVWNDMTSSGMNDNVEAAVLIEEGKNQKNSFEERARKRNKHKDNEDTVTQLLESDQFWKWLTDWTAVYMDVLEEHIKEAVHQEVADQMRTPAEEHETDYKEQEYDSSSS